MMSETPETEPLAGKENQPAVEHEQGQPGLRDQASIEKIQELLKTKNDTTRFVGLALVKTILDNSVELRDDEKSIVQLWDCISPTFVQRLLRTGCAPKAGQKDAKDMLDLAVSVIHKFAILLPETKRREAALVDKIPMLIECLLHSSEETTKLTLEALATIVNSPEGSKTFAGVDDLSPLTEIAPSHPLSLDVLSLAWLNSASLAQDTQNLSSKIDKTIQALVSSFKGTDAVTLLGFLSHLLRNLEIETIPRNPTWLESVVSFIHKLVSSKPTAAGRSAYTNLSATLLQVYPLKATKLLFSSDTTSDKPLSYLLVNLLLIDIQSTLPALLEQLNSPSYPPTSHRLSSAYDIISAFIGHLLQSLDSPSPSPTPLTPSHLLTLRTSLSTTMSSTIAHLRDRHDASLAGAPGLHPSAVPTPIHHPLGRGTHFAIAWDDASASITTDAFVLAAVRALALWLREDDGETLRREAAGLTDMFVSLYRTTPGFRRAVLVALEGVTAGEDGVGALLENEGWGVLVGDMLGILEGGATVSGDEEAAARGVEIVRVLLPVVEAETAVEEEWMAVVTRVAGWAVPDGRQGPVVEEFEVAVLQLVTALLAGAHPGMRRRYRHSMSAVIGIANQLRRSVGDRGLEDSLDDVLAALEDLRL